MKKTESNSCFVKAIIFHFYCRNSNAMKIMVRIYFNMLHTCCVCISMGVSHIPVKTTGYNIDLIWIQTVRSFRV